MKGHSSHIPKSVGTIDDWFSCETLAHETSKVSINSKISLTLLVPANCNRDFDIILAAPLVGFR